MTKTILIGCDPELFAYTSGWPISVHDKLPGSKANPVEVPNGAIQVDGVAAEFNIQPARNEGEFLNNVLSVKSFMQNLLSISHPGVQLLAVPTAKFDPEYFKLLPKDALELGCEPDFNAYTGKANPKPATNKPIRTGSGHIHIGYRDTLDGSFNDPNSKLFHENRTLVQDLDATLAAVAPLWDDDEERRELYGQAGSFRPKSYGVEYRVLSNAWLRSEDTIKYVYKLAYATVDMFLKGGSVKNELDRFPKPNSILSLLHNFELLHLPLPSENMIAGLNAK